MREADASTRRWMSPPRFWLISAALSALCLVPVLLPYLFGTGANARWDWGFVYVTLRFVLLPPACALYLICAVVAALRSKRDSNVERWITAGLAPVPLVILLLMYSWKNPMPPGSP